MPEAEVSLRLAFWLINQKMVEGEVSIAIDGAQVQVGDREIFPIRDFLKNLQWYKEDLLQTWQGLYSQATGLGKIRIHSNPGKGDIIARLRSGHTLRAECKKGPPIPNASSQELPLLREALGQLLTVQEYLDNDILAVAVPHSPRFAGLAQRWRGAPLIKKLGIQILTIGRDDNVFGFIEPEPNITK